MQRSVHSNHRAYPQHAVDLAALFGGEHLEGLGRHPRVLVQDDVAVPFHLLHPLLPSVHGLQFALRRLAGLIKFGEGFVQLLVGHVTFGGEPLVAATLRFHLGELVEPSLGLAVRIAAHSLALLFNHHVQIGAKLDGIGEERADKLPDATLHLGGAVHLLVPTRAVVPLPRTPVVEVADVGVSPAKRAVMPHVSTTEVTPEESSRQLPNPSVRGRQPPVVPDCFSGCIYPFPRDAGVGDRYGDPLLSGFRLGLPPLTVDLGTRPALRNVGVSAALGVVPEDSVELVRVQSDCHFRPYQRFDLFVWWGGTRR